MLIASCCSRNPLAVDVDRLPQHPLTLQRLDRDLFAAKPDSGQRLTPVNLAKYGPLYDHYIMTFLDPKGVHDSLYEKELLSFTSDSDVRGAHREIQSIYLDSRVEELRAQTELCVRRFMYYFPGRKAPQRIVTCQSGWNYSFACMDSALIVALDMYLGDTSRYYKMLRYPAYQVRKMKPEYILPDIARGWLLTEFDNMTASSVLIDHTIFYGKLFYGVQALLPETEDSLIIGYTGKQIAYCKEFEKKLWGYFAEKNRLFETNMNAVRELTSDGPFTGVIHKDCPPRIAMWIGWQIVRSYMRKTGSSLQSLFAEKDARRILARSGYRP